MWIFEWPLGWFGSGTGPTIFLKPGIKVKTLYRTSRRQTRSTINRVQTRFTSE